MPIRYALTSLPGALDGLSPRTRCRADVISLNPSLIALDDAVAAVTPIRR
jgi:hypothetical protein